jgi:hypothetical protein
MGSMFLGCENRASRDSCGREETALHSSRGMALWMGCNKLKTQEIKAHEFY